MSLLDGLEKINVTDAATKIACPVLIIHGDADTVVPVEDAYELNERLSNSTRLLILEGTDHRLADPSSMNRAVCEAVDWLGGYLH